MSRNKKAKKYTISVETKELLHEYARHNRDNPRAEMGLE